MSEPIRDEAFRIAEPCPMPWDGMQGGTQQRHCAHCNLHVHNFSALTRAEAEALMQRSAGQRICGAYARDAEGQIAWQRSHRTARFFRRGARLMLNTLALVGLLGGASGCSESSATGTPPGSIGAPTTAVPAPPRQPLLRRMENTLRRHEPFKSVIDWIDPVPVMAGAMMPSFSAPAAAPVPVTCAPGASSAAAPPA